MGGFLTLVEPVVILNSIGSSFYDTALTLAIYSRCNETSGGQSDEAQTLSSDFFRVYSSLGSLVSLLSTVPLGRLADRRGQKVLLVVPQLGSILGKSFLLFLILYRLPLYVLYVGVCLHGICGGSPAYWSGVISLAAMRSGPRSRSMRLNSVDFVSGVAGIIGSLISGYVYRVKVSDGQTGVLLIFVSLLVCGAGLFYSAFILNYPAIAEREEGNPGCLALGDSSERGEMDRGAVALLFAAMILFVLGMSGAEKVICLFVLKPPLSWDSVWVGYGQAATNMMYLTSFAGVLLLSRWLSDPALILLGIVSNCTGMAIMAFAQHSWVYFTARGIMMFACIPMPTIRSQLSKLMDAQSYGRIFGWLQSSLAVTDVLSTFLFTGVYPLTLDWYSGFCFLLSALVSYLSAVPILYLNYRRERCGYSRLSGTDSPHSAINT
ncbi:thymic stromal cotransporter protein-like isoform X1 [Acipenser ruthenus]|uniref:thymic stromal cotransporter protein-like isoform X1 n=2 Tax=Acipenser ruthenus TaxID=7906 RepID=UPI002740452D|nr:thymic stromal cotransporter protein-like isoform X1 [Acipenser ruthenus]